MPNSDYLFCEAYGIDGNTYYYTSMFVGNYSDSSAYGQSWTDCLVASGVDLVNDGTCGRRSADSLDGAIEIHNAHLADMSGPAKNYNIQEMDNCMPNT